MALEIHVLDFTFGAGGVGVGVGVAVTGPGVLGSNIEVGSTIRVVVGDVGGCREV